MRQTELFDNYKYCSVCRKPLSLDYKGDLCPFCIDQQLLHEVKEFIRENDVNEYDVASYFNIPLPKVKNWIREGRIEYKDKRLNNIMFHCAKCGEPITFGTHCAKCMRQQGTVVHASSSHAGEPSRMRYLDKENKK